MITSAHVSGHDANPTNAISSVLEFALSSLVIVSDEQYESISDDEIALFTRKCPTLHKFYKEMKRSPRGCFECSDTTHFIADFLNGKKFDSSNKYDYTNQNDYINKCDNKKKNHFGDNNNKKKFQKIMSRACAALSDFDFSSEDSSSSKEDEKIKCKKCDFTGLCLMGKSSRNDFDSDSDVTDDLSFERLSSKVVKLENALCNQDKLLCKVFCENKRLNFERENSFFEIASLRSLHDDISAKPCKNCNMILINYADLWIVHTQVASQLKGAKLKLKELKAHSLLLGSCTSCRMLKSDLEACSIEIKELKQRLDHSSRYKDFSPPCEVCGTLKGNLLHATKENSELKQEVAYLSARLERTKLNGKMIEDDLSRVEESETKSTNKLGIGFERCEDKGEKSAPKFLPISNYHKEEETLKSTKTHYPSNTKPSFNPKREVKKETLKLREEVFIFIFCGRAGHLDEFYFRCKRMEKRRFDYARNSYRDEFIDFSPHTSSRASPNFFH
jgi:hypothetical protein